MWIGFSYRKYFIIRIFILLAVNLAFLACVLIVSLVLGVGGSLRFWGAALALFAFNITLLGWLEFPLHLACCEVTGEPMRQQIHEGQEVRIRLRCVNHGRKITLSYSPTGFSYDRVLDMKNNTSVVDEDPTLVLPDVEKKIVVLEIGETRLIEIPLVMESVPRKHCYLTGSITIRFEAWSRMLGRQKDNSTISIPFELNVLLQGG